MVDFVIRLAEIPIEIKADYQSTKAFCADFFCEEEPLFSVCIDETDLNSEREIAIKEGGETGLEYLEISAVYRKIAKELLDYDILLFHASAIMRGNKAILFSADSGVGKTTHTKLWQSLYGDEVQVINGDKPLLKVDENKITVYSSPWMGKERMGSDISAELKNICIVERAQNNRIEKSSAEREFSTLARQIVLPKEEKKIKKAMSLFGRVLEMSEFYHLYCNTDSDAARVAYEGMKEGKTVKGRSMLPFLVQGRDRVFISEPNEIEKLDVILYRRKNGKQVLHRVYKIDAERYYCVGDYENYGEWVDKCDIVGVLNKVIRNGKEIKRGDSEFAKYARLAYYSYPARKIYLTLRRK